MYNVYYAHSWRKHTLAALYISKEVSRKWQEIEQKIIEKQNKSSQNIQSYALRNGHFMQLNRCQTIYHKNFQKWYCIR